MVDGEKQQLVYSVRVRSGNFEQMDTKLQGAAWDGETSTLSRLLNNVATKNDDGGYDDLASEEIPWEYCTMQ